MRVVAQAETKSWREALARHRAENPRLRIRDAARLLTRRCAWWAAPMPLDRCPAFVRFVALQRQRTLRSSDRAFFASTRGDTMKPAHYCTFSCHDSVLTKGMATQTQAPLGVPANLLLAFIAQTLHLWSHDCPHSRARLDWLLEHLRELFPHDRDWQRLCDQAQGYLTQRQRRKTDV